MSKRNVVIYRPRPPGEMPPAKVTRNGFQGRMPSLAEWRSMAPLDGRSISNRYVALMVIMAMAIGALAMGWWEDSTGKNQTIAAVQAHNEELSGITGGLMAIAKSATSTLEAQKKGEATKLPLPEGETMVTILAMSIATLGFFLMVGMRGSPNAVPAGVVIVLIGCWVLSLTGGGN